MKQIKLLKYLLAALVVCPLVALAQTKIVLGHTGIADYAASFIAKEQGMFSKRGLDVDLLLIPGGGAMPGLQSGSTQITTVPPTAMLQGVEAGIDVVALAGCSIIPKTGVNPAVVTRTGGSINSAQDLLGKKIGIVALGGTLHVMTRMWLREQGVDDRKVGFVEASFLSLGDLLKGGTVEAVVLADPFLGRALQTGAAKVLAPLAANLPETTTGIFYAALRDWVKKNPAAAKSFSESIAEAVLFARQNPDVAKAHIAKYTRLPPKVVAEMDMPNLRAEVTEQQLQFWIDSMRSQDLLKINPKPGTLIAR